MLATKGKEVSYHVNGLGEPCSKQAQLKFQENCSKIAVYLV